MEPGVIRPLRNAAAALALLALPVASAAAQEATSQGSGAELRALDKLTGDVIDITLAAGTADSLARIEVELRECRYPEGDPAGDAFAYLTVREIGEDTPVFRGWMIAASPALNPMDHPRYDVWVLRCTTS